MEIGNSDVESGMRDRDLRRTREREAKDGRTRTLRGRKGPGRLRGQDADGAGDRWQKRETVVFRNPTALALMSIRERPRGMARRVPEGGGRRREDEDRERERLRI